jgi:TM2 domain-containing membrane protein YozV
MKNKTTAALLALFLGGFGIHRFYLGNIFIGLLYLLFCWTYIPMVLGVIDFLFFIVRSQSSFDQEYNKNFLPRF